MTMNEKKLPFTKSHAFVIGIDEYRHLPKLSTAVNDAKKIAEVLERDQGFEIHSLLLDAGYEAIRELLEKRMCEVVGAKDRALFYFAGHGVAVDCEEVPEGYIIPADADFSGKGKFISMRDLYNAVSDLPCKHFLLILDCCFAGSFRWASRYRHISTLLPKVIYKQRFERYLADPAWQVITSSASDQRTLDVLDPLGKRDDESMGHSPFAQALVKGLEGEADLVPKDKGDGVITAAELYLYLRQQVEPESMACSARLRQTPGLFHLPRHEKGEYIFMNPGHILNLDPVPGRNPYKGLQSFEEKDKDLFYGRERVIADLMQKIDETNLFVVTSASGTGKSSLVKAGLVPELKSVGYKVLGIMRPCSDPVNDLERLFFDSLPLAPGVSLVNDKGLELIARELCRVKTLLVIDQYEELITRGTKEYERDHFMNILAELLNISNSGLFKVIITLRADFEPHFSHSYLKPYWQKARFVVPPFTAAELRQIIVLPAEQESVYFEPPALIDRIVNDVAQASGPLPLLSFTLEKLFDVSIKKCRHRTLHGKDYEELGGVIGAMHRQADELYKKLKPDQKRTMQNIMLRMVSLEGGELSGKRIMMDDLVYNDGEENNRIDHVIAKLIDARLIVKGKDSNHISFIEPAHDALIKGWAALWRWRSSFGEHNIFSHDRLSEAVKDWLQKPQYKLTGEATAALRRKRVPSRVLMKLEALKERSFLNQGKLKKALHSTIGKRSTRKYLPVILKQARVKKRGHDPFLWDDDPRLDEAIEIGRSKGCWLNKNEERFVDESMKARRHKKRQKRMTVSSVMAGLLLLAAFVGFKAVEVRNEARIAMANDCTSRAQLVLKEDPIIALRYAEKAYHLYKKHESGTVMQILSAAAASTLDNPFYSVNMMHEKPVSKAIFSPSGDLLLTVSFGKAARLWTLAGQVKLVISQPTGNIFDASFSPDGKKLLTVSSDHAAALWNLKGKRLASFNEHTGPLVSACFAPDGKFILTASRDNTAKLWDNRGNRLRNFEHTTDVKKAIFSPDGTTILTHSDDIIRLWNLSGSLLAKPKHNIRFAAFSPKNKQLLIFSLFNAIHIIDFSGNPLRDFGKREKTAGYAVWSPDGSRVLIVYPKGDMIVWKPEDGSCIHFDKQHSWDIHSAVFSHDGNFILTASGDKTARLWNLMGEQLLCLYRHTGDVNSARFSPDGTKILTASLDRTARLWDLRDRPAVDLKLHGGEVTCGQFSPDGSKIVTASHDGTARLWDLSGKSLVSLDKHTGIVNSVAFSPDGSTIVTASADQTARLWSLAGTCLIEYKGHTANVNTVLFSPDGKKIVTASYDNSAKLWDMQGNCLCTFNHSKNVTSARFSPDGLRVLTTSHDKTVKLWTLRGGLLIDFKEHFSYVNSAVFSPDGIKVLTASLDNTAKLWDLHNETYINLPHHKGVASAVFSPDGSKIVTASHDKTAKLWDVHGNLLKSLNRHKAQVYSAVFSPDGSHILTASADNTVKLWDLNGSLLADFDKHRGSVHSALFSPDGSRILSVSSDGTGKTWCTPEAIIQWLKRAPIAHLPPEPKLKNVDIK